MQQKVAALASENERQSGIIMGLEQMVEEAGVEKLQLLKYCHELELRALNVEVMNDNPYDAPAARSDASMLLDLQQVSHSGVSFVVVGMSNVFLQRLAAASAVTSSQTQQPT